MFRLIGLLGGLSLVTDIGTGAPLEESLRRAVVATRLGRAAGCIDSEVAAVLYASLLQHLGCTAYSHEVARMWGDDVASTRLAFLTDFTDRSDTWRSWVSGIADTTGRSKARVITTMLAGKKLDTAGPVATCDVARSASRPGPLSQSERDQARLHPYHTQRILSRVPDLIRFAALAGQHHERSDGSGYHRGLSAAQLAMPSRVLAALDAYRGLVEGRPHRPQRTEAEAAQRLVAQGRAGPTGCRCRERSLDGCRTSTRRETHPSRWSQRTAGGRAPFGGERDVEPRDRKAALDLTPYC